MYIEIVTHCWRYPRLLSYHLSSVVLNPPTGLDLVVTVFHAPIDGPVCDVLGAFGPLAPPRVRWRWWPVPKEELCRRAIGRNRAALATEADWVWFCDADYCFGAACLDALPPALDRVNSNLAFPRWNYVSRSQADGDRLIEAATGTPAVRALAPAEFIPRRNARAIGGIQIARGDACRAKGYCNELPRRLRPAANWTRCNEDPLFRRSMGTRGTPIALPALYRIRHTRAGRIDRDVLL